MVNLEEVSVVGLGVDFAVVFVLEPVGGAFNSVDIVGAFILRFELGGHVNFDCCLPN
jgi:hypothetical protein